MQEKKASIDELRSLQEKLRQAESDRIALELRCDVLAHELAKLKQHAEVRARTLARQASRLQAARNEAEATAKERGYFLARISHELRTPLSIIVSAVEEMSGSPCHRQIPRLATIITDHARSASAILNDILEFTRNEAGTLAIEPSRFCVRTETKATVRPFAHRARRKGLEFSLTFDPSVPTAVLGDAQRYRQVLNNVINNAVKFTSQGRVEVAIWFDDTGLHAAVKDTGIGIRHAHRESMFRAFWQMDSSASRRFEGSGLGLAICRQIMTAMGGSIDVSSKHGEGTTVEIVLPMTIARRARQKQQVDPAFLHGARVLIVEDNAIILRLMTRLMERFGCRVVAADSGQAALQQVRNQPFDLIFMDCQMPGMDGFQTTEMIRAFEGRHRRTPIIAVTAHALEQDRIKCLQSGMDAHLVKPVERELLLSTLADVLGKSKAVKEPSLGELLASA